MQTTTRAQLIRDKLQQALTPNQLDIIDESHKHAGHAGNVSGAGYFVVRIASPLFDGKKLLECHRMIYQALNDVMEAEIHALRIEIIKS